MKHLVTSTDEMESLPLGSVVVALHRRFHDYAAWVKTDDTERLDEFHDVLAQAWMSPTYTADRTAAELLAESEHIELVWTPETAEATA